MGEFKRNLKNIIRNLILGTRLKDTNYVKNKFKQRQERLEKERSILFKKYANEALENIKDIFDKENLEFWLDYGTLLGAVREKDFIAHDIDIDLGMMYDSDSIKIIELAFDRNNIKKHREFKLDNKIVEQTYSYKGLCFDIFYYFNNKEIMWTYGFTYKNNKLKKISEGNIDISTGFEGMKYTSKNRGVEKYIFKGKEYLIPEDVHEYLQTNYGENYMTPNDEWDYVEEAKNQKKLPLNSNIVMIEYFN